MSKFIIDNYDNVNNILLYRILNGNLKKKECIVTLIKMINNIVFKQCKFN